ncbi:hypothetical protein GOODEAATRI_025442, partial [Goodea atripinnis]
TISLVYLVTAVVGVETWYQPVIWNLLYRDLFTFMIIGLLISSVFLFCDITHEPLQCVKVSTVHTCFYSIQLFGTQGSESFTLDFFRAYRSNTLKHSSLYEAFLPFLSPVLLFVLSTTWVIFSPSKILELQPRMYYLMVGTAFANVTDRSPQEL